MKHYLLSIYQPAGELPPGDLKKIMADVRHVDEELRSAGAWVFSGGLHPPETATVLRRRDSAMTMTDGPFTEAKEHIGGLTIIAVPDLDAALAWGRKLSAATTLPVEVRPFQGVA
ncbi:MAG: hypothetical protein JWN81_759 [Solirubrobacterales bacterium]|jgi:hypothetical protein|nr:hypothetical protein [Solirubrobacterales bacterium]